MKNDDQKQGSLLATQEDVREAADYVVNVISGSTMFITLMVISVTVDIGMSISRLVPLVFGGTAVVILYAFTVPGKSRPSSWKKKEH